MPSVSIPTAVVAAGVTGAATLGSGLMQANAASQAAQDQENAAKSAQALQQQEFQQTQQNLSPWMTTGSSALQQIASLYGLGPGGNGQPNTAGMMSALQSYPGYQFALQQGDQSLDRVAASRGLSLSGAQLKDSQQFGQGLATQTFGNYMSGLQGLSQQGLGAAGSLGNFASNYANASGQMGLAAGQAQAAGVVGSTNAITSGLQGALGNSLFAYNQFGGGGIPGGFTNSPMQAVTNPYAGVGPISDPTAGLSMNPWSS
jgi:hypothetical protein